MQYSDPVFTVLIALSATSMVWGLGRKWKAKLDQQKREAAGLRPGPGAFVGVQLVRRGWLYGSKRPGAVLEVERSGLSLRALERTPVDERLVAQLDDDVEGAAPYSFHFDANSWRPTALPDQDDPTLELVDASGRRAQVEVPTELADAIRERMRQRGWRRVSAD